MKLFAAIFLFCFRVVAVEPLELYNPESRHVFPCLSVYRIEHCAHVDPKFLGEKMVADNPLNVEAPELRNDFRIENGCPLPLASGNSFRVRNTAMSFSASGTLPSLLHHVFHVVGLRAKKKMIWITTSRVVAFVKDKDGFWDVSVTDYPRNSIGLALCLVNDKASVAKPSERACPIPAHAQFWSVLWNISELVYFFPKGGNARCGKVDFLSLPINSSIEFTHIYPMFEFSNALAATTAAHCDFKEVA